ncbi:MAG: hypothetical protein QG673_2169 [Pseudomonadota bacterium]|nr:hypothetical protein [Pseudomonadota bacterium]
MQIVNGFIELRIFIVNTDFPLLKTYVKNLWTMVKKSEDLVDIYLTNNGGSGDILKIRNSSVRYKKLIFSSNGINIFHFQKSVKTDMDISNYIKTSIRKKRKTYFLSTGSKLEVGKIEVFNKKYYTVCVEALDITDFVFLCNKIGIANLLPAAIRDSNNQIINGYNQFIAYLSLS